MSLNQRRGCVQVDRCCPPSQLYFKQDFFFLLRGTKSTQTCLNAPSAKRKCTLVRPVWNIYFLHTKGTKNRERTKWKSSCYAIQCKYVDVSNEDILVWITARGINQEESCQVMHVNFRVFPAWNFCNIDVTK